MTWRACAAEGLAESPPSLLPSEDADPAALDEALAEYQIIFDNAIVGICYTRERVIVRCNRRFEEMFGYGSGELNQKNTLVIYPSLQEYERIGHRGYEYLLDHKTYSDERLMRRKAGDLFWCNVAGKALNPEKPMQGAIWIFQDISERKRAEDALARAHERLEHRVQERTAELRKANEALRAEMEMRHEVQEALAASREMYRILFETFPIGISITDGDGNVSEINQALSRISTLSTLATITRDIKSQGGSLIHPDGRSFVRTELPSVRALAEHRVVSDVELGHRNASGRIRWFSVTAAPIPVRGYGAVVAYQEITERKRLEEKEQIQRLELARVARINTMGEMAAALAHELGQPLVATLNYLHGCQLRLDGGEYDPELFRSAISQAIRHAEQAGEIVRHVRQFVRRHEPETVPTDLNALIEQIAGFLEFERRQHKVPIHLSLAPELPVMRIDPLEINQVMVNLIKNGLEAMDGIGESERLLEITSQRKGPNWVEVQVSDRGPGISKKQLSQIFTSFFTTKPNGLGLGLAICRSIIESHGGQLTAGRNVHSGAVFRFTLPCKE